MSVPTGDNSEFARVIAVLKEIGKESLLDVFRNRELTVGAKNSINATYP